MPLSHDFLVHIYPMGCIPSKHVVLKDGTVVTERELKKMNKMNKKHGPASPVIPGEAPPWVQGHRVVQIHQGQVLSEQG
jgi:hypothetical protein